MHGKYKVSPPFLLGPLYPLVIYLGLSPPPTVRNNQTVLALCNHSVIWIFQQKLLVSRNFYQLIMGIAQQYSDDDNGIHNTAIRNGWDRAFLFVRIS